MGHRAMSVQCGSQYAELPKANWHILHILEPFSESTILQLEDVFLSAGTHHITLPSQATAQLLINTFLKLLPVHHNVAYIAQNTSAKSVYSATDIYQELVSGNYLSSIDDFFYDHFHYDFIWIEASKSIEAAPWFQEFEKNIHEFQAAKPIPILYIHYQNE